MVVGGDTLPVFEQRKVWHIKVGPPSDCENATFEVQVERFRNCDDVGFEAASRCVNVTKFLVIVRCWL